MSEPEATLHSWSEMPLEELGPKLARRVITAERMMIAHIHLEQGAIVPKHSHEHEQIAYVLEGRLRFVLGDDDSQVVEVGAGEVLCIPSNLPHSAEALERTLDVDVFCPPREDWLSGEDSYLRGS